MSDSILPVDGFSNARRRFLTGLGMAGAGAAAMGLTGPGQSAALAGHELIARFDGSRVRDPDILNFALNLEYLEAEFYLRAVFGRGLSDGDVSGQGDAGEVTGGNQVNFETPVIRQYAAEIAADEEAHVKFLRAALEPRRRFAGQRNTRSAGPVARPAINLDESFTAAAIAAGIIEEGQTFDAFANENNFLLAAFIFEDVGVTAYRGGAQFLRDPAILSAAAGILGTEAYHAGEIRTVLFNRGMATPSLGIYAAVDAISDLRDTADNTGEDGHDGAEPNADKDQPITGVFPPLDAGDVTGDADAHANIVPTDANGLVFARTFQQVLNIVYLGGERANFGFFPNRLNGLIR